MLSLPPRFLGIETSCDETALALIEGRTILAHKLYTQCKEHVSFGGVVPSIAAAAHLEVLPQLLQSLQEDIPLHTVGGIAVTTGPGLVGGLLVGFMVAQGLALSLKKPLWPVHHVAAHALMVGMEHEVPFPYLALLVSGGHCALVVVKSPLDYQVLGQTLDDAVGECLDKVAREMGLGYPGGPAVEAMARQAPAFLHHRAPIKLPIPLRGDKSCAFSFSGLKTAAIQAIHRYEQEKPLHTEEKAFLCHELQEVILKSLQERLENALKLQPLCHTVVLSGGVAANARFREGIAQTAEAGKRRFVAPAVAHCTDNGVMIAWAGYQQYLMGIPPGECRIRPHWPLDTLSL